MKSFMFQYMHSPPAPIPSHTTTCVCRCCCPPPLAFTLCGLNNLSAEICPSGTGLGEMTACRRSAQSEHDGSVNHAGRHFPGSPARPRARLVARTRTNEQNGDGFMASNNANANANAGVYSLPPTSAIYSWKKQHRRVTRGNFTSGNGNIVYCLHSGALVTPAQDSPLIPSERLLKR